MQQINDNTHPSHGRYSLISILHSLLIDYHPQDYSSNIPTSGPSENAEYDIYFNYLLVEKRGIPLWEPGPNMRYPIEYRRGGINIGDVGILYHTGYFAFLFNIFLSADDEINRGRVPDGFIPLDKSKVEKNIKIYDHGSCLVSASVQRTGSSSVPISDIFSQA
jgi:hypothetical protein